MTAPLLLGVDGGGSKTEAWLVQGSPGDRPAQHEGESGPSNLESCGVEAAWESVHTAVDGAFAEAGIEPRCVDVACLCVAGSSNPDLRQAFRETALRNRLARRLVVLHDAAALLAGAFPSGVGVALISGTGSIAFGRNRAGLCARAGGAGPKLGDAGSGHDLATRALQAVERAARGIGSRTALTSLLAEQLGLSEPEQILEQLSRLEPDALAAHAKVLTSAADQGDTVAIEILEQAAGALADNVVQVSEVLGLRTGFPIAFGGGALIHSSPLRRATLWQLGNRGISPEPLELVPRPVQGAVSIARLALEDQFDESSWWW